MGLLNFIWDGHLQYYETKIGREEDSQFDKPFFQKRRKKRRKKHNLPAREKEIKNFCIPRKKIDSQLLFLRFSAGAEGDFLLKLASFTHLHFPNFLFALRLPAASPPALITQNGAIYDGFMGGGERRKGCFQVMKGKFSSHLPNRLSFIN